MMKGLSPIQHHCDFEVFLWRPFPVFLVDKSMCSGLAGVGDGAGGGGGEIQKRVLSDSL